MSHNHTQLAADWNGWGASTWIADGWWYFLLPGECCLRLATNGANSGTPPGSFDPDWFDTGNYGGTVTAPDPLGADGDNMTITYGGWQWWGPRNRYYRRFYDGIGKGPTMICGASPATDPMLAFDPEDASSQLVLLPGAVS